MNLDQGLNLIERMKQEEELTPDSYVYTVIAEEFVQWLYASGFMIITEDEYDGLIPQDDDEVEL